MTPESNGCAPGGNATWAGSDTRAGSQVTVCGVRLVFRQTTVWPRTIMTAGGSKRRSGVIETFPAPSGEVVAGAAALGLATAAGELTGLAAPTTVGGGPPGVGGGAGSGAAPRTGVDGCALGVLDAGDGPGDTLLEAHAATAMVMPNWPSVKSMARRPSGCATWLDTAP
jgi:hypothetical protein